MRKIILLEFMTLDGVIQAPGGPEEDENGKFEFGGWSAPLNDDDFGKFMEEQMAGEYDLLLGRITYDIFASYWPHHGDFWPQVNKINKYVATTSPIESEWKGTKILKNTVAIKKLKAEDGPPLQVYGSANLAQTLLKNDLVDDLWLKTYPLTLGKGKKLFAEGTIPAAFELTESRVTSKGVIFANYKRAGKVITGRIEV